VSCVMSCILNLQKVRVFLIYCYDAPPPRNCSHQNIAERSRQSKGGGCWLAHFTTVNSSQNMFGLQSVGLSSQESTHTPSQHKQTMGDYVLNANALNEIKNSQSESDSFETWNAEQLAEYISKQGLAEYSKYIIQHKISGKLAPLLSESDLKEMGIRCIGDRLRFRMIVENLKRKSRVIDRSRCLWEGKERVFFSDTTAAFCTCFGFCPVDPSTYRLMSNYIKVKKVKPLRLGPLRLCCCNEYTTNNVDLTYLTNVDVIGVPASCCESILCCAPGKDIVDIEIRGVGGDAFYHKVVLREGEGDQVAFLILNGVEQSQRMDRE